jgi:hypothetical protein
MNRPDRVAVARPFLAVACCIGAAVPSVSAFTPPPVLRFIAPPQGYPDSFGDGLNADGSTALVLTGTLDTFSTAATGLWADSAQGGDLTMLPNPGSATMWLGRALSAAGDSVLTSVMVGPDAEEYWSWSAEEGWMRIDALSGGFTYIGSSSTGAAAVTLGFDGYQLWTPTAGLTGVFAPGDIGDISSTNADGSVLVGWHDQQPSRWMASTGWQHLVAEGFPGYARALFSSDSGRTVIGFGRVDVQDLVPRLWWWEESRGGIEWLTHQQFDQPFIQAMSGNGRVAVGSLARSACTVTHENGVTDLNAYLAAQGVDVQGRWLVSANGVSVNGSTIVGTAFRGGLPGETHSEAFVLRLRVCPADVGRAGGESGADGMLDNNDFIAFIDHFFSLVAVADRGSAGAVPEPDGRFDNNDFVVFVDQFFEGC